MCYSSQKNGIFHVNFDMNILKNIQNFEKFKMAANIWGGEKFLKIAKSTFLRYPVGRKFRRNRSISTPQWVDIILLMAQLKFTAQLHKCGFR